MRRLSRAWRLVPLAVRAVSGLRAPQVLSVLRRTRNPHDFGLSLLPWAVAPPPVPRSPSPRWLPVVVPHPAVLVRQNRPPHSRSATLTPRPQNQDLFGEALPLLTHPAQILP